MINADELLAFAAALVKTTREYIKYSASMSGPEQLFEDAEDNYFMNKIWKRENILKQREFSENRITIAQKSIELRAGRCAELTMLAIYIAEMVDVKFPEKVYLTGIGLDSDHTFLMIHQDEFFSIECLEDTALCDDLNALKDIKGFSNGVIADPWVYMACKVRELEKLEEVSKDYNVESSYSGSIFIEKNMSGIVSRLKNSREDIAKYHFLIKSFENFYAQEVAKLRGNSNYSVSGRSFFKVKQSLDSNIRSIAATNIQSYHLRVKAVRQVRQVRQNTCMRELKLFVGILKNSSSGWYSEFGHSDTKGNMLNLVLRYLQRCIDNRDYPDDDKLKNIFSAILQILPLVRGKVRPARLNLSNIHMTRTAKSLLSIQATPDNKRLFESIEGLSLDWIRDIRRGNGTERMRYFTLLQQIYPDRIYNIYTNMEKLFYYSRLQNLVPD